MIALPFILNSLLNFVVGLLVAKFLGPDEYGRFAVTLSIAVVIQTLGLDWMRLAATRFLSGGDEAATRAYRGTLDAAFAGVALIASLAIAAIILIEPALPISTALAALAIVTALANGLFDLSAAILRAQFRDRAYARLVIAKNILACALSAGGALVFGSAKIALIGLIVSVAGSIALTPATRPSGDQSLRLADRATLRRYMAYGLPIVVANVLYQAIPLIDRSILASTLSFAEVGQFALAYEIGLRIFSSVGSALDAYLFQLAVRADGEQGVEVGQRQIATNMVLIFGVLAPAIAGAWLILPSVNALLIPEQYREAFPHYFTLLLPAFLGFALSSYCVGPAFQLMHRTGLWILGALVAFTTNALVLLVAPQGTDASRFALAQSLAWVAASVSVSICFVATSRIRPRLRDMGAIMLSVAVMVAATLRLRDLSPGIVTLILQMASAGVVYAVAIWITNACDVRAFVSRRLPPSHRRQSPVG